MKAINAEHGGDKMQQAGEYIDVAAIARDTGLSRGFVYKAAAAGALQHLRVGRAIRVRRDVFEKWVEEHTRGGNKQVAA